MSSWVSRPSASPGGRAASAASAASGASGGVATLRFDDPRTSDFVVACEGREVAVHKSVLIQRSPFLRRFLEADAACARINASNARYAAMVVVLRSLYANPAVGEEFGAHRFDPVVVTSCWEIAMHFQLGDFAAIATTRLLELVDRDHALRVLKATLKHPSSGNAKSLQQHLVAAHLIPPTLHSSEDRTAWEQILVEQPWLQDALKAHEERQKPHHHATAVTPTNSVPGLRSPRQATDSKPPLGSTTPRQEATEDGREERLEDIRNSYNKYLSRRNSPRARPNATTSPGGVLGLLGAGTPGKGVEYDAVDIEDDDGDGVDDVRRRHEASREDLTASASKLREGVERAHDELADINAALNTMKFGGVNDDTAADDDRYARRGGSRGESRSSSAVGDTRPSRAFRRFNSDDGATRNRPHAKVAVMTENGGAGTVKLAAHRHIEAKHSKRTKKKNRGDPAATARARERAQEAALLAAEIERLKSTYATELATFHQRCDDLRGDMDAAIDNDVGAVEARCDELQEAVRDLKDAEAAEEAERDQLRQEAATADAFIRDGELYLRAVDDAVEELAGVVDAIASSSRQGGGGRSATRREVGAIALDAKKQRDDQQAALDVAKDKEAALEQLLAEEHATVKRLQQTLRSHDEDELDATGEIIDDAY